MPILAIEHMFVEQQTLLIKEPIMKINNCKRVLILFVLVFITTAGTLLAGELMDKVFINDIEAVKQILAAGADINEQDENISGAGKGATPLFIACSYYAEMAILLISKGADINITTYGGDSPLMAAFFISEKPHKRQRL